MNGVNHVVLLGTLGADPELKFTPAGKAVCNLRLATNETWKDAQGQKQERTEWHRVTCWGTTAEIAGKYLVKGRQVYIDGRLQTRAWEKNGEKRYSTEIVAEKLVLLGDRRGGRSSDEMPGAASQEPSPVSDEDIPF